MLRVMIAISTTVQVVVTVDLLINFDDHVHDFIKEATHISKYVDEKSGTVKTLCIVLYISMLNIRCIKYLWIVGFFVITKNRKVRTAYTKNRQNYNLEHFWHLRVCKEQEERLKRSCGEDERLSKLINTYFMGGNSMFGLS